MFGCAGRRRSAQFFDARRFGFTLSVPLGKSLNRANITGIRKIAFFAARPMSITNPIWAKTSFSKMVEL
jgi:hypothetical protein